MMGRIERVRFVEKEGLRYYQFDLFKGQPLFHAVLTRRGGFSKKPYESLNTAGTVGDDPMAVLKNHQKIYQVLGYEFYSRFDVWQVHSSTVICADAPRGAGIPHDKADGILTNNPQVTLFMRFGDCVPILLVDPVSKAIGIIHAGWQGTYQRIAQKAIEKMVACYGSDPKSILAGIGPSICQDCYEVGPEVYQAFLMGFGEKGNCYFNQHQGSYHLDLCKANREMLMEVGVQRIEMSGMCTACHLDEWYSHRGEQGQTGRFGVLMALKS